MASITFSYGTVIPSTWLNDVNAAVFTTIPNHTTAIQTNGTAIQGLSQSIQTNTTSIQGIVNSKDASSGFVGLTGYGINFMSTDGSIKSTFANVNTASRTYTFPDRSITVAGTVNETLTTPTIKGYIEQVQSPTGTTITVDPTLGTIIKVTLAADTTIVLPTPVDGMCYTVLVIYNGVFTPTFSGGGTLKWSSGGTVPAPTKVAGKLDKYVFTGVGGITYAQDGGRNF